MAMDLSTVNSEKRCTPFPGSLDVLNNSHFATADSETGATKMQPAKLQKRPRPPPLPVTVKRVSDQSLERTKRLEQEFCHFGTPWTKYERFTQEGEKTYLAFEPRSLTASTVAVKMHKNMKTSASSLIRTSHVGLVNLKEVFVDTHESITFFIYEKMDISLDHLHSTVELGEMHIAAICKEVLHGLSYVHTELCISHGHIRCESIMLTVSGLVKIGDIGYSMLRREGNMDEDIHAIGWMMTEIMEPGTGYLCPKTVKLEKPAIWSADIKDFQRKTQVASISDLLSDRFLLISATVSKISVLVTMGNRMAGKDWNVFTQT